MVNFEEKLLPVFKGNSTRVKTYLDYITTKATVKGEIYTESHHILPEQVFPEYAKQKWNRVHLTAYDHYVAHYLLAFSYHPDMLFALNNMNRLKKINIRKQLEIISEEQLTNMAEMYSEFRTDLAKVISNLNKGRIRTLEQRSANSLARKGKINVIHRITGELVLITTEEYKNNKRIYKSFAEGRKHSQKTKDIMSEKSIKGKTAYSHIITSEIVYAHDSPGDDWIKGVPSQQKKATERFEGGSHWTNIETGEQCRQKECPGENWIKKRQNFTNAYSGKTSGIDLITGERILVETDKKLYHQVVHNKMIYVYRDEVFVEKSEIQSILGLPEKIIDNGITIAKVSPSKVTTSKLLKNLDNNTKMKYKHLIGKTFDDIFGEISKIPAKSIAGKLDELKLSIRAERSPI